MESSYMWRNITYNPDFTRFKYLQIMRKLYSNLLFFPLLLLDRVPFYTDECIPVINICVVVVTTARLHRVPFHTDRSVRYNFR